MAPPKEHTCSAKRKRLDDEESENDQQFKQTKLHQRLHRTLRELRKVVKKARTYEVQKALKKLKDARRKGVDHDLIKDLESQVEALKHLNYNQLAQTALVTKLKKNKELFSDPSVQSAATKLASNVVSPGAPGTPMTKVQSRILSSKVLASEIMSVVQSLKTLLHASLGSGDIKGAAMGSHKSSNLSQRKRAKTGPKNSSNDNAMNLSQGYEETNDDEAVIEVDDDWESGTIDVSSESDDSVAELPDGSNDVAHDQGSSDGADTQSENPRCKARKTPVHHPIIGRSEFIPSLSVGFTRGNSESEFSDSEAKLADGIKKNRRGQRARRAIWEKKFGKNANHIKKFQQPGTVQIDRRSRKGNSLSQPHHTVRGSRALTQYHRGGPTMRGRINAGTSERRLQLKGHLREKRGEQLLHPSWEAKKKQKIANIVPSQGTKIVFSES